MKIHVLQHNAFEGPAYISEWAAKHQHTMTFTKFFEAFSIPFPSDIDLLIVLGGSMSVNDTENYPWICDEKDYIHQMIRKGCKVLGICLGAQMIARAMGADVFPNQLKEIGWFPIRKNHQAKLDFFTEIPDELLAFHWHSDTFELPGGAERIFSSKACENQGFILNKNVYALQFHWEVTVESVQQMIEFCGDDIGEGKFVQPAKTLLDKPENFMEVNKLLEQLLDHIVQS